MKNKLQYYCNTCLQSYEASSEKLFCLYCKKVVPIIHGIPVFSNDIYWGKIAEPELKNIIDLIENHGFDAFSLQLQKKLDFTFDEDRADWIFFIPPSARS